MMRRRWAVPGVVAVVALGVTLASPMTAMSNSVGVVASAPNPAGDWPQPWQDPAGTLANLEETSLSAATVKSLRVVWHRSPTFALDSGAVIDGGVAYYGDGLENVFAVDAASGVKRWQYKLPEKSNAEGVVAGPNLLYVEVTLWPERTGGIYALDKADGHVVWRYLPSSTNHRYRPGLLAGNRYYAYFAGGPFVSLTRRQAG